MNVLIPRLALGFIPQLGARPRRSRIAVLLAMDVVLAVVSTYLAFASRYDDLAFFRSIPDSAALVPWSAVAGLAVVLLFRQPWVRISALQTTSLTRFGVSAVVFALLLAAMGFMLTTLVPRSVPPIAGIMFFSLTVGVRVLSLNLMRYTGSRATDVTRVAIYGAGRAGMQLATALQHSPEYHVSFFLDDDRALQGMKISNLAVFSPADLDRLARRHRVDLVMIAIPSETPTRLVEISRHVRDAGLTVKILPGVAGMLEADPDAARARGIDPERLLGRDMVDLDDASINRTYADRCVMVTGAGGSIGSELCRQLTNCGPREIVLFEQSEFALYAINHELEALAREKQIRVSAVLGDVTDAAQLRNAMVTRGVEVILHAAAYKHVPIVEVNEIAGARTNVLGTATIACAAIEAGVSHLVLISTDKAVRPTNVMGATKRLAELVIQDLAGRSGQTRFSAVRFGNVLGSSGSVIPLFQKQIAAGGPVTVTHPDVTRYFMTIPEASRLVLLAGAVSRGGDLFVLDMGGPKKILDIAHQMIALSGRTVLDPVTGKGDIAIEFTGLRPGEKLYEELLIDHENLCPTPHPKILRAQEAGLDEVEMVEVLKRLGRIIDARDVAALRALLRDVVEGYEPGATAVAAHPVVPVRRDKAAACPVTASTDLRPAIAQAQA